MIDIKSKNLVSILHPQIQVVGGAMKQMLYLAEYLSKGNTVTIYTFLGNGNIRSQNNRYSIKHSFSSYPLKFLSFFIIAWQIRHSNCIVCGNSPMHFVACFSKIFFRSKAKIIWWHHHYPWYHMKNTGITTYLKKIIEKNIVGKVDTIVGNSRFLKKNLTLIYGRNVEVVFPLIDTEYYKNIPSQYRGINQKKVLFAGGRWDVGKGLKDIFAIYNEVKKKEDIELLVSGEGGELEKYRKIYRNDPSVKMLGQLSVREMRKIFIKADIFLFPSVIDSFGMVIIESLLSGTPVICYNKGEASFIIENNENGYKVEDLEEYILKVRRLLSDDILRKKISETTRKSVVSNYSMKHFEEQWKKIIFEK